MERSDERLSTRDIASPSGGESEAAAPPRDRDYDDRDAATADRDATPVGDGDVVSDEPARFEREPAAERGEPSPAAAAPAPTAGMTADTTGTAADETGPTADTADRTARADTTPDTTTGAGTRDSTTGDNAPLLADADGFQARWEEIQVRFVDEPRGAVEDADALVATVMKRLAEGFAQERERLEAQWGRGEDISTEDLRVALQRYRSFFQRLLST